MESVDETSGAHNLEANAPAQGQIPTVENTSVPNDKDTEGDEEKDVLEGQTGCSDVVGTVGSTETPLDETIKSDEDVHSEAHEVPDTNDVLEQSGDANDEVVEKYDHIDAGEAEGGGFDDEDDDFGSFDEASIEEVLEPEPETELDAAFSSAVLHDFTQFKKNLDDLLDQIIPSADQEAKPLSSELLTEKASEKLKMFSALPRLNPPNWTRLKMRHGLLVSLGIPINLDELESSHNVPASKPTSKRRSITELDIQWGDFVVPEIETLSLSADRQQELMSQTLNILLRIEDDNLTNTTEQFLQLSAEAVVDEKLLQMQNNYSQLVELSSVWQAQLKELRNSQEMFESVVQDMVGYRQKLQRNEILESISKSKRGKRVF